MPREPYNPPNLAVSLHFLCASVPALQIRLLHPHPIAITPALKAGNCLSPGRPSVSKGVCMGIQIPADYRPSEAEPFMNERQREYFRRKLNGWKEEILKESRETIQNLQAETVPPADLADRPSTE